jgi:uracil-DNA glycosylase
MAQKTDLKAVLTLLEQVLLQRKSAGLDTVPLSKPGLEQLQNLPTVFFRARSSSTKAAPKTTPTAAPVSKPAPVPPKAEPKPAEPKAVIEQVVAPQTAQTAPGSDPQILKSSNPPSPYGDLAVKTEMRGRVEIIFPAGDNPRDQLNNLFRLAKRCEVCRELGTLRDQLVFASGDPQSRLMYIGEAPTAEDEEAKKPFSGPSGQKLNTILQTMGLKREAVYFSNILKYRPKIGDGRFQGPKNRKATPDELAASIKYVRSEIEVIKPKLIVALGATVAESLLEESGSITNLRQKNFQLDGIPVVVAYEPAYLVRLDAEADPEIARQEKRKVWEDALKIMEKLGMPISEKQRGYFSR